MTEQSENNIVVELRQPMKKRLSLVSGILICALVDVYLYKDLAIGKEAGWITIALGTILSILLLFLLFVHLFITPQQMIIEGDTISIAMLFRKRRRINIADIVKVHYSPFFSLVAVDNSGWLVCSSNKKKYLIAKPFFINFDDLIESIRRHNPTCLIDEEVLNWKGPRYLT
jgi:hypothetical protein